MAPNTPYAVEDDESTHPVAVSVGTQRPPTQLLTNLIAGLLVGVFTIIYCVSFAALNL